MKAKGQSGKTRGRQRTSQQIVSDLCRALRQSTHSHTKPWSMYTLQVGGGGGPILKWALCLSCSQTTSKEGKEWCPTQPGQARSGCSKPRDFFVPPAARGELLKCSPRKRRPLRTTGINQDIPSEVLPKRDLESLILLVDYTIQTKTHFLNTASELLHGS